MDKYTLAFIILAICVGVIAWYGLEAIFTLGVAIGELKCK